MPVAPSKLKFVIVVCVPPKLIASSPIVTVEFAKLAFEIAAEPDKLAFTNPEIVFEPAAIVLFVKVSVVSFNTIVPVEFGIVTVLSAVGFSTVKTVSKSSEVVPSNVNEFVTSIVVESIIY